MSDEKKIRTIPMVWCNRVYVIALQPDNHVIVYHKAEPVGNGNWSNVEEAVTDGKGSEKLLGEDGWDAVDAAIRKTIADNKPFGSEHIIVINSELSMVKQPCTCKENVTPNNGICTVCGGMTVQV